MIEIPYCVQLQMLAMCAWQAVRVLTFSKDYEKIDNDVTDHALVVCTLEECLQLQDGIECIFLNLCSSHHIGEDIHAGFPHLYVVAWRTVVQDRVAQAFAREFYTYLGVESSKGNRGSVAEAYAAAERDFHAKYREGDPTVYDEAGNRTGKKDSSVHGVPMLLRPVGWS